MKNYSASIDSIESMGLVDGPGIRTVIFFNGCKLRCKFCHNPETWNLKDKNYTLEEVYNKVVRNKPYFNNNGGVTYSGGEPLMHTDFLIELSKKLKKENIHIALDTAGVGIGNYEELLKYIDLVIFDIKGITNEFYKNMTGYDMDESLKFLELCQKLNKKLWLRQVIVPGYNDNIEYIDELRLFIKDIKNVEKVELLPYHTMGIDKYKKLNIEYELSNIKDMDKERCKELEELLNK